MRMSVDLPAPFSPTNAWISPKSALKSTLSSARVAPNCLVSPSTLAADVTLMRAAQRIGEGAGNRSSPNLRTPPSSRNLLLFEHAPHGGTRQHAILERRVVLELAHRQFPPDSPCIEDETIGIEHGVAVEKPILARQHAVDLLEIAMKRLKPLCLDGWEGRWIGRIALGPPNMGVRWMHTGGEETDQRQRLRLRLQIGWPQAVALAEIGQDRRVLG